MRRSLLVSGLLLSSTLAFGCSHAEIHADEALTGEAESEVISRVKGSSTGSAYAKANATYLSVRSLDTLARVGALKGAVADVAARADGILANQPADGRVSLKELVKLEQPGIVETLFPEEKAALPKVWALMETASGSAVATPALGALPTIDVTDLSTAAGTLTPPAVLAIDSLPSELQLVARRVQLTQNGDGDPTSIAPADISLALATPDPYTPTEVAQLKKIQQLFADRAASSIRTRAEVTAPFSKSTTIGTFGSVTIAVDDRLSYVESRHLWLSSPSYPAGSLDRTLQGEIERRVTLTTAGIVDVVLLHEQSEAETVVDPSHVAVKAGVTTLEVWANGTRQSSHRVNFKDDLESRTDQTDLGPWLDYELVAGGAPLVKNVTAASQRGVYNAGAAYQASFTYDAAPTPAPSDADLSVLRRLATPTELLAGRYSVDVPGRGTFTIEISSTGVVWLTRPGSAKVRASLYVWGTQAKFTVNYPDRYRMVLDPGAGVVKFFLDGSSTDFDGPLSASLRTG